MKRDWGALALRPVTTAGAAWGLVYAVITRRRPPLWFLMASGMATIVALVWGVLKLAGF